MKFLSYKTRYKRGYNRIKTMTYEYDFPIKIKFCENMVIHSFAFVNAMFCIKQTRANLRISRYDQNKH